MNQTTKYANYIPMRELNTVDKQLYPFNAYNELLEQTPVRYDENRKCWDVFRYDDVQYVLKNPKLFSSQRNRSNQSLLYMDPPKHKQLRDLVNQAFTLKKIEQLAPHIRSIAEDLLSSHLPNGRIDLVHELAGPLPVIVIAELIGVPTSDRNIFKHLSDLLVKGARDDSEEAFQELMDEKAKAHEELDQYFMNIVNERRHALKDDLVSLLIEAEIEGQKLSDLEIVRFCILLLVAGNETTTNLITNAVRILCEQPELQQRIAEQPGLIPTTVEETLRYYPPIVAIGRVASEEVVLQGQTIQPGQQVISWVGAANWDERKFSQSEQFVPDRKPNQHMGFGFGIHFCLGAPLARLEGRIVLETLLAHMREMKLEAGATLKPIQSAFVFGVQEYPVVFDAID